MFSKILVANRGEIACRIMRTARAMGIKTVAVYSEADLSALHVKFADEAVSIGEAAIGGSYLNPESIIEACLVTGAEAIHPGYGFLSENADFANDLKRAGVTFIGPKAEVIAAMGDKVQAKKIAEKAGVPTVPGYLGVVNGVDNAIAVAAEIGYPVIIKASAGGGGKGMRIAYSASDITEGLERAASEASAAFGDGRVFIEKFVEEPRHIEVQLLADEFGNVIHLGERECSIQRRHQKVLEEAPSPYLDANTRKAIGAQAVVLANAVGYSSAGTVEFIFDSNRNFYFLEMNTRLQVEHPVTECITGIDIVEQMIRIASGEKLSFHQQDVRFNGWALETRVYAEDPDRGFLPSIGRLVKYMEPERSDIVRIDSGVEEGSEITSFYDPMIAKVITSGKNRAEALSAMENALDVFAVRGIDNNICFLRRVLGHKSFRSGNFSTNFIKDNWPVGFLTINKKSKDFINAILIGILVHCRYRLRRNSLSAEEWVILVNEDKVSIIFNWTDKVCSVTVGTREYQVVSEWQPGEILCQALVGGEPVVAQVDVLEEGLRVTIHGSVMDMIIRRPWVANLNHIMLIKEPADLSRYVLSPMPGLVLSIDVGEGEQVQIGQPLVVIDAMKMENVLTATKAGTIKKICTTEGKSLMTDQIILEFE